MILTNTVHYYLQHTDGKTSIVRGEAQYMFQAFTDASVEVLASGSIGDILGYIRTAAGV